MIYLQYTEGRIYNRIKYGFKDISSVIDFIYELPSEEMWIGCWNDEGKNLDNEVRKLIESKMKKIIEIERRKHEIEKDFV